MYVGEYDIEELSPEVRLFLFKQKQLQHFTRIAIKHVCTQLQQWKMPCVSLEKCVYVTMNPLGVLEVDTAMRDAMEIQKNHVVPHICKITIKLLMSMGK